MTIKLKLASLIAQIPVLFCTFSTIGHVTITYCVNYFVLGQS